MLYARNHGIMFHPSCSMLEEQDNIDLLHLVYSTNDLNA